MCAGMRLLISDYRFSVFAEEELTGKILIKLVKILLQIFHEQYIYSFSSY
jgi:hypothetical protein